MMNPRLKEIVDEIESARSELVRIVTDASEAETRARADPCQWSIGEILHHLFLIETVGDRITAPQSVIPAKDMSRGELLALLSDSRSKLRDAIGEAHSIDLGRMQFPHPVLGRIDMYQWILYVGKHERRHIAQIARVKGA